MDATTFTANASTNVITNAAKFKPDFVWAKSRTDAYSHELYNSVVGATKYLVSNATVAETTDANSLLSFNSNGFTLGYNSGANYTNGASAVGWQWQAGQGTTSTNTSGSITSTVSVNTTAGFSIVTYTGNGGNNQSVGHGLGATPGMTIVKDRTSGSNHWLVHNQAMATGYTVYLDLTYAQDSGSGQWGTSAQTSSVFYIGASGGGASNTNGNNYVAYCWAPVAGYSAFGSYTGNGSTDGPFIYTGFRPKFFIVKCTTDAGQQWLMLDTSRSPYNVAQETLFPDSFGVEQLNPRLDFLSNGIKIRNTYGNQNTNGSTYVYACFAENPFKYANAR
jgi:hypothetical protein